MEDPLGLADYRVGIPPQSEETLYDHELLWTDPATIRSYVEGYFVHPDPKVYEALADVLIRVTLSPDYPRWARAAALTFQMIYQQPVPYEYRLIAPPTLLIVGEKDHVVPDCGHIPHLEYPDQFLGAILAIPGNYVNTLLLPSGSLLENPLFLLRSRRRLWYTTSDIPPVPRRIVMSLGLVRLETETSVAHRAYAALRAGLMDMNIYERRDQDLRLDERDLAEKLGVSRTPIREALVRLEHEGLVESVPRRGYFIVRKTRRELVETIKVWAALESMAARLITEHASDEEISSLRTIFSTFENGKIYAKLDEYSDANLAFHQRIIELARSVTLSKMADSLVIHVRSIRHRTISENRRFERSIIDHMEIIEALEAREGELAEKLVRDHALGLAAHVAEHVNDF